MVILKDTSLCAIVKDEIMNPAGGILDFVESTVPFVEEAVIVDTGSADGTRPVLEECQSRYRNLHVYDRPFDNYAASRNFSLDYATKQWVLVLDADERLAKKDFEMVAEELAATPRRINGYEFVVLEVFSNGEEYVDDGPLNPRLFKRRGARFEGAWGETVDLRAFRGNESKVQIKHFLSSQSADEQKMNDWYKTWPRTKDFFRGERDAPSRPDHQRDCPSFSEWKQYNPVREKYR